MEPTEPLTEDSLDKLRSLYAQSESPEGKLIVKLLDEIDELDDALHASEDEVESLRAKNAQLRRLVEPKAPSVSLSKTRAGAWAVRWRDGDLRRSQSFPTRRQAESFRAAMLDRWNGGAE